MTTTTSPECESPGEVCSDEYWRIVKLGGLLAVCTSAVKLHEIRGQEGQPEDQDAGFIASRSSRRNSSCSITASIRNNIDKAAYA